MVSRVMGGNRYGRKTHAKAAAHAVGRGAGRERRLMADVDWNGGETEPPVGSHHDPENRGQAGPRVDLQEHEVAERMDDRLVLVPADRLQYLRVIRQPQVPAGVPAAA